MAHDATADFAGYWARATRNAELIVAGFDCYRPRNSDWFAWALIDRAAQSPDGRNNRGLAWAGDAFMEAMVRKELVRRYPDRAVGGLEPIRNQAVSNLSLAEIAETLNLGQLVVLPEQHPRILAVGYETILGSAVEAIIGALIMDGADQIAHSFIARHLHPVIDRVMADGIERNPVAELHTLCARRYGATPCYVPHQDQKTRDLDKQWYVDAFLHDRYLGYGEGRSKRIAIQNAARASLRNLEILGRVPSAS